MDDVGGNALLWSLAVVAYQTLHTLRENHLSGSWRTAQPKRLRLWLFRQPAKLTAHSRKSYLQLLRGEPVRRCLLASLRALNHGILLRFRPEPFGPAAPRGSPPRSSHRCRHHGRRSSIFGLSSVSEKPVPAPVHLRFASLNVNSHHPASVQAQTGQIRAALQDPGSHPPRHVREALSRAGRG